MALYTMRPSARVCITLIRLSSSKHTCDEVLNEMLQLKFYENARSTGSDVIRLQNTSSKMTSVITNIGPVPTECPLRSHRIGAFETFYLTGPLTHLCRQHKARAEQREAAAS